MKRLLSLLFVLLAVQFPHIGSGAEKPAYDILIRNGRVVDGTGNPWYHSDVAIKDGHIARIARDIDPKLAGIIVDAANQIVAPGFIDVHTHIEDEAFTTPTADNFVRQGVTSVITGNCGGSVTDVAAYFERIQRGGITPNIGTLIGHNSVRRVGMGGSFPRDPSAEEMEKMKFLVDKAMEDGAVGFSTGLIYVPGTYSKPEEVVTLAKEAAKYGGLYATHMRDEGEHVMEAIDEAIRIGSEARMPVEISHFKVANKKLWGQSTKTLQKVLDARQHGIDVFVDQYPYTASSTNLGVLIPSWALAEGSEKVKGRLSDLAIREKIKSEMKEGLKRRNGREDYSYAVIANFRPDPSINGQSISEVARGRWNGQRLNLQAVPNSLYEIREKPAKAAGADRRLLRLAKKKELKKKDDRLEAEMETILDLLLAGGASMIYHSMDERDVERIMRAPFTAIASDSGFIKFGNAMPNPRGYGSNVKVLGEYSRDKGLFTVEEAVRKMTSLPAMVFKLKDRGVLREGAWADIVVFDDSKIRDKATFQNPHQYAEGVSDVFINGVAVVEKGAQNALKPGMILYGAGRKQTPP
jgi:N-acyl-D-amino-acid deacylase